jgi:hypothetical protein
MCKEASLFLVRTCEIITFIDPMYFTSKKNVTVMTHTGAHLILFKKKL